MIFYLYMGLFSVSIPICNFSDVFLFFIQVNPIAVNSKYCNVFTENKRVVSIISTVDFGKVCLAINFFARMHGFSFIPIYLLVAYKPFMHFIFYSCFCTSCILAIIMRFAIFLKCFQSSLAPLQFILSLHACILFVSQRVFYDVESGSICCNRSYNGWQH